MEKQRGFCYNLEKAKGDELPMTRIYVVRHAEAEGNVYRRMHGQYESGITANGRRQIEALSQRFRDIPVDACYTSDLIRTQITAKAVSVPQNLPLHLEPAFREIAAGTWENVPFGWLYTYDLVRMKQFDDEPENWYVEGAENFSSCTDRFINGLKRVGEQHPGGTVCVFTHGGVIRGMLRRLFPDAVVGHSDNTAVTLLEYESGSFRAVYINDNSHLNDEISTLARQSWWKEDEAERILDRNLWFREERVALQPLTPPDAPIVFTAYFEEAPVGTLRLQYLDDSTGQLLYMGLIPEFRGTGLAIQLLGQAVFYFREKGKATLLLQVPEDQPAVLQLCRGQGMVQENDRFTLDLRLRV